jgi:hypothetical protein
LDTRLTATSFSMKPSSLSPRLRSRSLLLMWIPGFAYGLWPLMVVVGTGNSSQENLASPKA